ncbi:MAG: Bug family tripartite tricarboxylate transporter substrate binding protein, partial [Pollutimonas bauzanensis]
MKNLNRLRLGAATCAAFTALGAACLLAPVKAQTAGFPSKPITLVVGFSPGGSNDIVARAIAQPLAEDLGVSVVVENRVGAAGMIGTNHVAQASPDGYTL